MREALRITNPTPLRLVQLPAAEESTAKTMTPNLDIMLCSLPPAEASNVFHNEVVEDHQIERSLLYREMVILLAIALFVAIRAVIL